MSLYIGTSRRVSLQATFQSVSNTLSLLDSVEMSVAFRPSHDSDYLNTQVT